MRTRTALVVVALLIVVGSLAWWAFATGAHEREAAPPSAKQAPAADTPGEPAAPVETAEKPGASAERQAVTDAAQAEGVWLRVVDLAGRTPIAGVVVHYQPDTFDWNRLATETKKDLSSLASRDSELFLQRIGQSLVTDGNGRCRVPLGKNGAQVIGRKDSLFGQTWLSADGDPAKPHELVLREDHTLRVRLVDDAGKPVAGVAINLATAEDGVRQPRGEFARTDSEGRVTQRHCQMFAGDKATCPAEVVANPAGGEVAKAAFDLAAPPVEEIVLRLPRLGSITVTALDTTGRPLDARYLGEPLVVLVAFDAEPKDIREEVDGFNKRAWHAPLDPSGKATFAPAVMGKYFIAQVGGYGRPAGKQGFAGPTAERPHVEVTLQPPKDVVVLTGRALRDRAPLGDRVLTVACRSGSTGGSARGRTDPEGRFRCHLWPLVAGQAVEVTLSLDPDASPLVTRMTRSLATGPNDLGDLELAPDGVLASGVLDREPVVDVEQVEIQVERQRDKRWEQDWNRRPRWLGGGRFEIRGPWVPGERVRLVVGQGEYLPVPPIECAAGAVDVRIPLRAACEVTAVFLVDDAVPIQRLIYRLREEGAPERLDMMAQMQERASASDVRSTESGKAHKTWKGLVAGTYTLSVLCGGIDEPVVAVEGIVVRRNAQPDARLQAVDLRGRVRLLRVRATNAEARPVVDDQSFVVPRGAAEGAWQGFHLGRGVAEVLTTGPVDLFVLVPGHRIATVHATADCTVPLQRCLTARLQVDVPAVLPEGMVFTLVLTPQIGLARGRIQLDNGRGMTLETFFEERVRVAASGLFEIPVRQSARYRIEATLSRGGLGGRVIRKVTPKEIELSADAPGPLQTIQFAADEIERVLTR